MESANQTVPFDANAYLNKLYTSMFLLLARRKPAFLPTAYTTEKQCQDIIDIIEFIKEHSSTTSETNVENSSISIPTENPFEKPFYLSFDSEESVKQYLINNVTFLSQKQLEYMLDLAENELIYIQLNLGKSYISDDDISRSERELYESIYTETNENQDVTPIEQKQTEYASKHPRLTSNLYEIARRTNPDTYYKIQQYCAFHPDDSKYILYLYKNYPSIARDKTISWHEKCFLVKVFNGTNVNPKKYYDESLRKVLDKCETIEQAKAAIAIWNETNWFNKNSIMTKLLERTDMLILDRIYSSDPKDMQQQAHSFYTQLRNNVEFIQPTNSSTPKTPKYTFDQNAFQKKYFDNLTVENKIAIENFIIAKGLSDRDTHDFLVFSIKSCQNQTGVDNEKLKDMLDNKFLYDLMPRIEINDAQQFNAIYVGHKNLIRFGKSQKHSAYHKGINDLIKHLENNPDKLAKLFSLCDSPENIQIIEKLYRTFGDKLDLENLNIEKLNAAFHAFDSIFKIDQQTDIQIYENTKTEALKKLLELTNDKEATADDIAKYQALSFYNLESNSDPHHYYNPLKQMNFTGDKIDYMTPLEITHLFANQLNFLQRTEPTEYDRKIFDRFNVQDSTNALTKLKKCDDPVSITQRQLYLLKNKDLEPDARNIIIANPAFVAIVPDNYPINTMDDINNLKDYFNEFMDKLEKPNGDFYIPNPYKNHGDYLESLTENNQPKWFPKIKDGEKVRQLLNHFVGIYKSAQKQLEKQQEITR